MLLTYAMKLTFLGTGESCDEKNYNVSALIESKINLLLDCGFSVPHQLLRYNDNPNFLDAVYITHFHADHCFGLPLLLLYMAEQKRKKPLTIIGQRGVEKKVKKITELAYGTFKDLKLVKFIKFLEIKDKFTFKGLGFQTAKTIHPRPNYSVKISDKKNSIFYGGDGAPRKRTKKLVNNCNLIIQECFQADKKIDGHFSLKEVIDYYKDIDFGKLALVHINREVRRKQMLKIKNMIKSSGLNIILPKPMQSFRL